MTVKDSEVGLQVQGLSLGSGGYGQLEGWNALFKPGLALLLDEEGEIKGRLLPLLAGELQPETGEVRWCGVAMAQHRQQSPGSVFWRDPRASWPDISPECWASEQASGYPTWDAAAWLAHVQGLGLQEHLQKEMFRLSTGSKRKVLLAAALASGAPLTLIDEPEAALDRASIVYLRQMLTQQAERHHETRRVWVVANYAPVPDVAWEQVIPLA